MARFEEVHCLFCGPTCAKERLLSAPDLLNGKPGIFHLSRCKTCHLVFQDPRPVAEDMGEFYTSEASFYQAPVTSKARKQGLKEKLAEITLANHLDYPGPKHFLLKTLTWPLYRIKVADQTIPHFKEGGKLLEIGCGSGNRLVRHRERGWSVTGVELQKEVADALEKSTGIRVISGNIETMELPDKYDAIVMDMVLEHLHNPIQILKQIRQWLKPDGELVLTIPYFEGLEFKLFGEYTYGLQLPYHLYFFNRRHLKKLLRDFHTPRFVFHHFDRDVVASAGYKSCHTRSFWWKIVSHSSLLRKCLVRPVVLIGSFLHLTSRITVRAAG